MLDEFENHTRERDLVGQMLMAYGEIEFALIGCVAEILEDNIHTTTRVLFRVNGEGARLNVADAILRPAMIKLKLADDWITAFSAAGCCKNIRNQYAHCHWHIEDGEIFFVDLDDDAKAKDDIMRVNLRPINLTLIQRQHDYFEYALGWLYFMKDALKLKKGKPISDPPFPKPKSIPQPPRDNHPKKAAPTPPVGPERKP
jgi:hypothetical protein